MPKRTVSKRKQIARENEAKCDHDWQIPIGTRNKDNTPIMFCKKCYSIITMEKK